MFYRPRWTDLFRLAWFSLIGGERRELRAKVDVTERVLDRVIAERDAALTENSRLHAELSKALLELASRASVASLRRWRRVLRGRRDNRYRTALSGKR